MKHNTLSHLKLFTVALLLVLLSVSSCKKTEDITIQTPKPEKVLIDVGAQVATATGSIVPRIKIIHLYRDTVYTLETQFEREAGEQLIIDEGTLIKVGNPELGPGGGITIKPGGLLIANGTRENPIVFTNRLNYGRQDQNWNGIVIKGKSVNNTSITGNEDVTDRSCSIKFMRIEFSSLTLEAVGSNSVVENIQVSYTKSRSSFRIFGGTFNARNLVSYACGGPADFYISQGYTGKMQNLLAYRHPFFGNTTGVSPYDDPEGSITFPIERRTAGLLIENDAEGTTQLPYTLPIISNITVIGPHLQNGIAKEYINPALRSAALVTANNARFKIRNSLFFGFPAAGWYLDGLQSAANFIQNSSELGFSSFQRSVDTTRTFTLTPNPLISNSQFKNFVLNGKYASQFNQGADAFYADPLNYENTSLLVKDSSPILKGANFEGADFSDSFFNKVTYVGALGNDNWLQGWTNFIPLRTNYNNPE